MFQDFPQFLFFVLGERSFENLALESFESLQHLVRGGLTHQYKESGGSRLERLTEFLDEIVVDTEITKLARKGAGADRSAKQLKLRADSEGLPYQTLLSSIVHKFVTDQLVDKKNILKSIELLKAQKNSLYTLATRPVDTPQP